MLYKKSADTLNILQRYMVKCLQGDENHPILYKNSQKQQLPPLVIPLNYH